MTSESVKKTKLMVTARDVWLTRGKEIQKVGGTHTMNTQENGSKGANQMDLLLFLKLTTLRLCT